jgi:hypothetical protein
LPEKILLFQWSIRQELNIGSNQPQMLTTIAQLKNAQPAPSIKASIMFIPSFTEYSYLLFLFSYLQKWMIVKPVAAPTPMPAAIVKSTSIFFASFKSYCFLYCDHIVSYRSLQVPCKPELFEKHCQCKKCSCTEYAAEYDHFLFPPFGYCLFPLL